ncbi:MAG TPA: GIY-YIG nuclease family protein [Syntrophaceae bacterium]|nr:GIY-YIG nuclease family protein [Syntrophaceae bacterium]
MKGRYKGIYVLIMRLPKRKVIKVGRLGDISFAGSFYAYVGSALNGIESRIKRHLSSNKKPFWHIDYLLEQASIISTIMSETDKKIECNIARNLVKTLPSIAGFGCSDCKCKSHLYFERNKQVLQEKVLEAFDRNGLVTMRNDK